MTYGLKSGRDLTNADKLNYFGLHWTRPIETIGELNAYCIQAMRFLIDTTSYATAMKMKSMTPCANFVT